MELVFQRRIIGTILVAALAQAGCAEDLVPKDNSGGIQGNIGLATTLTCTQGKVEVAAQGDVVSLCVDARDYNKWVYFKISTRAEVTPADPLNSTDWDFAFQRFYVRTNGGQSGNGGMQVAFEENRNFADITKAATGTYFSDIDGDQNGDNFKDFVFTAQPPDPDTINVGSILIGWFEYAVPATLKPRKVVYSVKAVDQKYYAVEMISYYDGAGTSGFLSLRFKPILNP